MDNQRDYDFPYTPYDIQTKLMNVIYESIDTGKISIVESPTGTGKSLSIICSILKWVSDFKSNEISDLKDKIEKLSFKLKESEKDSIDWLSNQLKQISERNEISDLNVKLENLSKHDCYCKTLKKNVKLSKHKNVDSTVVPVSKRSSDVVDIDQENDYDLIVQFDDDSLEDIKANKEDNHYKPKIFYCSRTHSQLSQFINEIKKTKKFHDSESILMLPLSSRANYCIHPIASRFNNVNILNEKCNEMQNSKQKCCMFKQTNMQQLREEILANVQDIEEIVTKGKNLNACPYFTTRMSISQAEIIVLPYQILLHKGTRESFGLDLKDSVVIVDEAHNLLETITSVYSIDIQLYQITLLMRFVTLYMSKYYSRFNSQNLMFIKQLLFILKKLSAFIKSSNVVDHLSMNPLDFVISLEIENINIFKLIQFIENSRIASKLHMFSLKCNSSNSIVQTNKKSKTSGTLDFLSKFKSSNKQALSNASKAIDVNKTKESDAQDEYLNTNTIHIIKDFLFSLKCFNIDGKVMISKNKDNIDQSTLKYLLLNPSSHFKDILNQCRSVILCGGTMKPFEDYYNQLFKPLNIPENRIMTFSCDHVIPQDNLVAFGCGQGPNQIALNYTYSNRSTADVVNETGQALIEFCHVIPKGVVVFFPSYDYEDFVLKQWERSGILKNFEKKCNKRVFQEPKKSSMVANILNNYTRWIKSSKDNGAILFSVIGGKMSEGINFSDDLGRGVVVIGLPYANKNSPDLSEKMTYLDTLGDNLGNDYYENLCMRAVNQSIGRAIRHINDYAAIVLLDQRYHTKATVKQKLSNWIQNRYKSYEQFNPILIQIKEFFNKKIVK